MALSKIDIANMVTGATPVANGGTGLTSGTSGQFLKFTGSTTLASAADNAGKVLQVVTETSTSRTSTNSTTFANLGLSKTITLSATSSKLLVIMEASVDQDSNNQNDHDNACRYRVTQNHSGISETVIYESQYGYVHPDTSGSDNMLRGTLSACVLISPSTTNEITINLDAKNNSSGHTINVVSDPSETYKTLTLMEIGA